MFFYFLNFLLRFHFFCGFSKWERICFLGLFSNRHLFFRLLNFDRFFHLFYWNTLFRWLNVLLGLCFSDRSGDGCLILIRILKNQILLGLIFLTQKGLSQIFLFKKCIFKGTPTHNHLCFLSFSFFFFLYCSFSLGGFVLLNIFSLFFFGTSCTKNRVDFFIFIIKHGFLF